MPPLESFLFSPIPSFLFVFPFSSGKFHQIRQAPFRAPSHPNRKPIQQSIENALFACCDAFGSIAAGFR
jgi:hypothetical protein